MAQHLPKAMVPFSLLDNPWLPVRRADGTRAWIRPAGITSDIGTNPVTGFDWSRADFDAASREFLIGLLATACAQRTGDAWLEWFEAPPSPEVLEAAFAPLRPFFLLDGSGPRFLQDQESFASDAVAAGQLLIESPGANTLKKNLDHFVRRGRIERLSRAGAAIALFTLQTFAPSGGAGHRTSLRGGGPLSTLIVPVSGVQSLWHLLWLNVVAPGVDPDEDEAAIAPERVFPWLAPARVSDKGQLTTPQHVHELTAYWAMPRRIRLEFAANPERQPCDLTGLVDDVVVQSYRTRPYGASYAGFMHPLSPYYKAKATDAEWLPVHGQPGRVGYRHWLGLAVASDDQSAPRRPAASVVQARRRLRRLRQAPAADPRLLAAGYDMDNMKARDFAESLMPIHLFRATEAAEEAFAETVRNLVKSARETAQILTRHMRDALPSADGDAGAVGLARDRFWDQTEQPFHRRLRRLAVDLHATAEDEAALAEHQRRARHDWLGIVAATAFDIFDALVPSAGFGERRLTEMDRIISARRNLGLALKGYGKAGASLFAALGQAPPQQRQRKGATT